MSYAYPPTEQALVARVVNQPGFKRLLDLPVLAWQEVLLLLGCYTAVCGGAALYLNGMLPYPLVLLVSALAVYASFTPLHDATHRSVSSSTWINDLIGTLSAQLLLPGATTALYRYMHLEHHRHTGDAELDPDERLVSAGPFGRLLNCMFVEVLWLRWYLDHNENRSRWENLQALATLLIYVGWHAAWLLSPFALEFVLLWMVPQRLGITITAYLFAAIQHPEGVLEHERPFQATRMFGGGTLVRVMMISQSQHLMHHLFPMVPYYRYNGAWKLSEPQLRDQVLVWNAPVGRLAMPVEDKQRHASLLTVRVERIEQVTDEIRAYTFASAAGTELPPFDAGAHIDVHIAPGLVRQYSLTGLAAPSRYSIAVKCEANGRGGSKSLHEKFVVGQTLQISRPRNLFALQSDDVHAVLVSGGIGITPMINMAQELQAMGASFAFHACARDEASLPFAMLLREADWAGRVRTWLGTDEGLQAASLPVYAPGYSLYLCGPAGFMKYVRKLAAERCWPESAIHSEEFKSPASATDNKPFSVELARSGQVIEVPADLTLLDALQKNQVPIAASCVQGLCGTCKCRVLDGDVEHRDHFFSAEERADGMMTTCVSRANDEGRLVLDL